MELRDAIRQGDIDRVRLLLQYTNPDITDTYGYTPLVVASMYGCVDISRLLLDRGADPNLGDRDHDTPLIVASINGEIDVSRLLLDRGADPNIQNSRHSTSLICASNYCYIDIVRLLLGYNADPNIQNRYGSTAYTLTDDDDIRGILREAIAKYGKSIYQCRDRSREYMSNVYSDINILM